MASDSRAVGMVLLSTTVGIGDPATDEHICMVATVLSQLLDLGEIGSS